MDVSLHEEDRERKCSLIFSSDSTMLISKKILKSIEVTIYRCNVHTFIYIICIILINICEKKKRRIATFVYLHKGLVVLHSFFTLSSVRRMHIAPFFFFLKHRNVPVHSSLKKQITNIYDLRCSITVSKSFKNARCMK